MSRDEATGSLFPEPEPARTQEPSRSSAPLADRMRPRSLDELLGQDEVLGPDSPLRRSIETGSMPSLILWGPPGSGKTTLARVIRSMGDSRFESLSAVLAGVKQVREVLHAASTRLRSDGHRTILFIDEIHRFNKAQQDALLSHVESGEVTLIGATTENPSFEVNGALLSRSRVVVLKALEVEDLARIVKRAIEDRERGLGALDLDVSEEAISFLARAADGDARTALNVLELAARNASVDGDAGKLGLEDMRKAFARKALLYDRAGEQHFSLISALHKSLRNSGADAALYWLARMIEAGEDPLYLARRLVRFASEDVGLADPQALPMAVAAQQAVHFVGLPEGALALAELVVYLAAAPKSNSVYRAYAAAAKDALETRAEAPPLALRNAPTQLMKELGYGRGYAYAHDEPDGVAAIDCLPDALAGRRYYRAGARGQEVEIARRLEAARRLADRRARDGSSE